MNESEQTKTILKALDESSCCSSCTFGWCCYEPVWCDEAEARIIVEHLRKTLTHEQFDEFKVRVHDTYEKAKASGLLELDHTETPLYSAKWRMNVGLPCPVFNEKTGKCSAYGERPMACKVHYASKSSDPAWCGDGRRYDLTRILEFHSSYMVPLMVDLIKSQGIKEVHLDHMIVLLYNEVFKESIETVSCCRGDVVHAGNDIQLHEK